MFKAEARVTGNVSDALRKVRQVRTELTKLTRVPTTVKVRVDSRAAGASARAAGDAMKRETQRAAAAMAREQERTRRALHAANLREAARNARQVADIQAKAARQASQQQANSARDAARVSNQAQRDAARVATQAQRDALRAQQQAQRDAARQAQRLADQTARAQAKAARDAARATQQAARQAQRAQEQAARAATRAAQEAARQQAAAARAAAREADRAAKAAARVNRQKISDGRSAAGELGNRASTAATTGSLLIAGGLLASTREAVLFEQAFAGVTKTVKASDAQLAAMSRRIRTMATSIPVATDELSKIAQTAGQLGIKFNNIARFTDVVAKLGVATNLTSETGSIQLARFANITKMSQKDFDRLGSTVVDLGNNFATTEKEIVNLAQRFAPVGVQMGLSETQILGLSAAISSLGVRSEAGASSISTSFVKIAKYVRAGGDELKLVAKTAGMTTSEFKKAFSADATAAMLKFTDGLGKLKKAGGDATGTLAELGLNDIRVRTTLLALANNTELAERAVKRANVAWKENTALNREAGIRFATTASQAKIAENRLRDLGITIGTGLVPALNTVFKEFGHFFDWFNKLDKATQSSIVRNAMYAAGILFVVGKLKGLIETIMLVRQALVASRLGMIAWAASGTRSAVLVGGAMTALQARIAALRAFGVAGFGALGIAIAALVAIVWGVRTAVIGFGDASSMSADKLIKKWGVLGQVWVKAGDYFGDLVSRINGSKAAGDAADAAVARINANRKAGKKAPKSAIWLQQHPGFNAQGVKIDGARAKGGPVRRGGTYLVGENGPELFMPKSTAGTIIPNGAVPTFPSPRAVSSSNSEAKLSALKAQIAALQHRIDERVIARARAGKHKSDVQLLQWRMLLRDMKAQAAGLRATEREASKASRAAKKAAKGLAPYKVPDVSMRGVVKNHTLRDLLDAPTDPQVAALVKRLGKDGLKLSKVRNNTNRNAWSVADYVNSPAFGRDMDKAQIDHSQAGKLKVRLFAEGVRKDQIAAETRALQAAQKAERERNTEIAKARKEAADMNREGEATLRILAAQDSYLANNPGDAKGLEKFTARLQKVYSLWRDSSSPVVRLFNAGKKNEASATFNSLMRQFDIGQSVTDGMDRMREEQEATNETFVNFNDTLKEFPAFADMAREGADKIRDALADTSGSATDLATVLTDLPDGLLALEDAGEAMQSKFAPFLGLLRSAKGAIQSRNKREKKAAIPDTIDALFGDARDVSEGAWGDISSERRASADEKLKLKRWELLRRQGDSVLNDLTAKIGRSGLSPEGARAALDEYKKIEAVWVSIVNSAKQLEKTQSSDRISAYLRDLNENARLGSISDPVLAEVENIKANLKHEGWSDEEIEAIVPATRAEVKARQMRERIVEASNGVYDSLVESFAGVREKGLASFDSLFSGVLNKLSDFSARWLADKAWGSINSVLGSLFGNLLGGLGGSMGSATASLGLPNIGPPKVDGSFSKGLRFVPKNNFVANLHYGEAILRKDEADMWRGDVGTSDDYKRSFAATDGAGPGGGAAGGMTVINNITYNVGKVEAKNPEEFNRKAGGSRLAASQIKRDLNRASNEGGTYR